jgi:hypothetical protein
MRSLLFMLGILAAVTGVGSPAAAQNYPWCALYDAGGGGGENCGFSTREQCNATVSGIGGFCMLNNTYVPPGGTTAARRRAR